jgi:putative YphP/YqiW family bacilliredoxin
MMFPEDMVSGMREELTRVGFREMRTPAEVDSVLKHEKRTVLVVVNSVCGCAAGKARPAIAKALSNKTRPEVLATVFAGQDPEATKQARAYFTGYAPSSPSIALLRDGKIEFMMERRDIEGSDPFTIAKVLTQAFDRICAPTAAPANQ